MENNRRKWSFSREVSVGDAVGLVVAFTAVLLAYSTLDRRVALLEQSQITGSEYSRNAISRMEESITEMNRKLDRLIERNSR